MADTNTPVGERVSTWGCIICGNLWMTCDTQPIGVVFGSLMLLIAALAVLSDKPAAQQEPKP